MPRYRVKLAAALKPVPEWWASEFHKRQATLRMLILRQLSRAGRPMAATELKQAATGYWASEHDWARQALIDEGVLVPIQHVQQRPCGKGVLTQTYTCFDLADRQSQGASSLDDR
jgi:hypothetical protein